MRKIMMVKKRKCCQIIVVEMQDLHEIFFNSGIVLINLIILCVDFGKHYKMKFKSFHLDVI
jgi:hypothetical protein